MIDYLLKFPSKTIAEQFGLANGFASIDENGSIVSRLASHEHALHEIGEHFIDQPIDSVYESDSEGNIESVPPIGDGQYWVLFRDLVGIPIPEGGEQFIVWSSSWTTSDESGIEQPITRPVDNPNIPNIWWC